MEKITIVFLVLTIIMFIVTMFVIHRINKNNYTKYIIIIPAFLFLAVFIILIGTIDFNNVGRIAAASLGSLLFIIIFYQYNKYLNPPLSK